MLHLGPLPQVPHPPPVPVAGGKPGRRCVDDRGIFRNENREMPSMPKTGEPGDVPGRGFPVSVPKKLNASKCTLSFLLDYD